jgi:hypothetical protein
MFTARYAQSPYTVHSKSRSALRLRHVDTCIGVGMDARGRHFQRLL